MSVALAHPPADWAYGASGTGLPTATSSVTTSETWNPLTPHSAGHNPFPDEVVRNIAPLSPLEGYAGHAPIPDASYLPPASWGEPGQVINDLPHRSLPVLSAPSSCCNEPQFQLLPPGLLFDTYLAGEKEPRISSAWLTEADRGLVWDATLGGRAGLWRYGMLGGPRPRGVQLDIEGGAMVRLDPEVNTDVEAVDFRFGFLVTTRSGPWSTKMGYAHISSHLGDEFVLRNPGFPRRNYVRDSAVAGLSFDVSETFRLYAETGYAIGHEGGALPLEFQYGAEYSSATTALKGGPYAAVNGHTREDEGWISGVNVLSGWQWRGTDTQHRFRIGMQYYQGPALQYSFVGRSEKVLGGGMWFDY